MTKFLAVVIVILAIIAIAQLARVYDLTRDLRGKREEDISPRDNRMNAVMMIVFMLAFFGFAIWQIVAFGNALPPAASEHGDALDALLNFNWWIVIAVFFLCNALLFFFAAKYYYREDRKAYYFPHDNKLEMIWTVVPALVLAVIIIYGLKTWQEITDTDNYSDDAIHVELYSMQFAWMARYGGEDTVLGPTNYLMIGDSSALGMINEGTVEERVAYYEGKLEEMDMILKANRKCDSCDAKMQNIEMALHKIDVLEMPENAHALKEIIAHHGHGGHHDGHADENAGHGQDEEHHGDGSGHGAGDGSGPGNGDGHGGGHAEHGDGHGHHGPAPLECVGDYQKYVDIYMNDPEHGAEELAHMWMECKTICDENISHLKSKTALAEMTARKKKFEILYSRVLGIGARLDKGIYQPGYDDVIVEGEFVLPVNREVQFYMRSKDVIHSAYMPHFRAQMNTVPGMVTPFRFTPTITTDSMRTILDDPNFDYTLLCNKICGANHYDMKMKIRVVSNKEYERWMESQEVDTPYKVAARAKAEETTTVAEIDPAAGEPAEAVEVIND